MAISQFTSLESRYQDKQLHNVIDNHNKTFQQRTSKQWYFNDIDFLYTPTQLQGYNLNDEKQLRFKGALFLVSLGNELKVNQWTISTALAFFHRYYMRAAFQERHYYKVAAGCMYCATLDCEEMRSIEDHISVAIKKTNKGKNEIVKNEMERKKWYDSIYKYAHEVYIKNCCAAQPDIPENYLVQFCERLKLDDNVQQMAKNIVYECNINSTVILRYHAHLIMAAAIYIAAEYYDFELSYQDGNTWYQQLDVDIEQVQDVIEYMLNVLNQR